MACTSRHNLIPFACAQHNVPPRNLDDAHLLPPRERLARVQCSGRPSNESKPTPRLRGGLRLVRGQVSTGTLVHYDHEQAVRERMGGPWVTVGFDSFEGLPEDWMPEWRKGSWSQGGVPVQVPGKACSRVA